MMGHQACSLYSFLIPGRSQLQAVRPQAAEAWAASHRSGTCVSTSILTSAPWSLQSPTAAGRPRSSPPPRCTRDGREHSGAQWSAWARMRYATFSDSSAYPLNAGQEAWRPAVPPVSAANPTLDACLSLGWYSPRSRFSSSPGCGRTGEDVGSALKMHGVFTMQSGQHSVSATHPSLLLQPWEAAVGRGWAGRLHAPQYWHIFP